MVARSEHESQVVRALGSVGAATLASRVLGFVRDMVVALAFGAGPLTDAFFVAFRIPNILRRLLGEGALSTSIVPIFTEYLVTRPRGEFERMFRAVLGLALVVLGGVTVLGVVVAPWLVRLFAPGFAAEPLALTVALTRLMFPYLILVGLGALVMGALNAEGRFFAAALAPAVLNLGMIASVLLLAPHVSPPIFALAIGVLAGGVGQLLAQLPDLTRARVPLRPSWELSHPALRRIGVRLVPSVFGLAGVQVTVFVNTLLASLLPSGSISYLYYADRVMEFPLGVFGIALASASLPAMSRQAATGDTAGLGRTVNFGLRLSCYIAIPASVGLIALQTPITRLLFQRGQFGPAETAATAWALGWYAVGLTGFSATRIVAQAFYAIGDPRTPVWTALAAVGINVVVAVALMLPMAHGGLALASSVAGYVNLGLLLWAFRRRVGPLGVREIATSLMRTAVAALAVAGWCALALWTWPSGATPASDAAWLAAAIGGGGVAFWVASALARSEERAALVLGLRWPRALLRRGRD
jgi:putative peptidoglycan lipid II flippase